MTPSVHTTITYGLDTGTIYVLIALGWMGMMAMMLYSEKPSGCSDEEKTNDTGNASIAYKPNELVSTDDFANNMETFIDKLTNHEIEKIGILHNDMLCAVAVSHENYQRLLQCSMLYTKEEAPHEDTAHTHGE